MNECERPDPEFRFTSYRPGAYSVEVAIHGDSTIVDLAEALRAFLLAVGYHHTNVDEVLPQ